MRIPVRLMAALSVTILGMASPAGADESCTSMQVFLGIAPNHRANVMSYIAPRLKEKFGVELVAEELGSAAMIERLTAQASAPRVSIIHWDVPVGVEACGRGLCAPIDLARIPNASNLYDWAITNDDQGKPALLATGVSAVGLIYNEEAFKKNGLAAPTSWNDLKRSDLAGRISLTSPASTWGMADLAMFARMNGGGEASIDPAFAFVQGVMPNVNTVHTWSSELSNLLQLGEVWMATTGSILAPPLRAQGLPVKWIVPKEGAPFVNAGLSLVKGAPCEKVAYEYINLYLSDEFQVLRAVDGGMSSASKTVWDKLPQQARANASLTPDDYAHLVPLDWATIAKVRADWLKRWQREVH